MERNPVEFIEMEEFEPWPGFFEWICENGMCEGVLSSMNV